MQWLFLSRTCGVGLFYLPGHTQYPLLLSSILHQYVMYPNIYQHTAASHPATSSEGEIAESVLRMAGPGTILLIKPDGRERMDRHRPPHYRAELQGRHG